MSGLKPTDLGIMEADDEVDGPPSVAGGEQLPPVSLPPRPADLRTKEGRAWKLAHDTGDPIKLDGSSSAKTATKNPRKHSEHLKRVLLQFHQKAADVTEISDLALDDDEATMLADSLSELASYYKIKLDGKGGALVAVLYAVTMIYGSRLLPYVLPSIIGLFKREETTEPENVIRPERFAPSL